MPSKNCPSCKAAVSDNAKFCPQCGTPLVALKPRSSTAQKTSNIRRDAIIIAGVIVIVVAGYFLINRPQVVVEPVGQIVSDHPDVEGMGAMAAAFANLPTDYDGLVQMGNQTMDQGNYPMAAECYKRALAINGQSTDVRTDYGACLHGMGLADRAIAEFNKVLKEIPNHSVAIYNLGIVYYNEEQYDSAKIYWTRYLNLEPNGPLAPSVKQLLQEIGG